MDERTRWAPDAELVAQFLHSRRDGRQIAQTLIEQWGGLPGILTTPVELLAQTHGVTLLDARRIHAALELGRRLGERQRPERRCAKTPQDLYNLVEPMRFLAREEMAVIALDLHNRVLGEPVTVYRGSLHSTVIRSAEMFQHAVMVGAAAVAVIHNHPSGDPTPSPEDVAVTRELVTAGKSLDIQLVDHIIIGNGRFFSLREYGLGFG